MSSSGVVRLGNIADKLSMLEVACSRCERHGRLGIAKLIERHGADAKLTDLRTILAGDCPRLGGAIYEQCGVHDPQLVRLWRKGGPERDACGRSGPFRACVHFPADRWRNSWEIGRHRLNEINQGGSD